MQENNHLLDFARNELKLINFDQSDLYEPILELLKQSSKMCNNDPETMKQLCALLPRLIDRKPLSAITEKDFETETHVEGDRSVEILRCTRYPYLYKMDGRYYDDRAVAFRRADSAETDRMYIYQTGNSSKQEVELPYFSREEVRVLQQEYQNLPDVNIEPDYEVE